MTHDRRRRCIEIALRLWQGKPNVEERAEWVDQVLRGLPCPTVSRVERETIDEAGRQIRVEEPTW